MLIRAKLLNFLGIITIVCYYMTESTGKPFSNEDEENTIKQALFLVELLRSDFGKILRENYNQKNITSNEIGEDDNSTCAVPDDIANTTTSFNESNSTGSYTSSPSAVTTTPGVITTAVPAVSSTPHASSTPSALLTILPAMLASPANPALLYSTWPRPIPGYPMLEPSRRVNFPEDEQYRFPYRMGRRRMMPDYYYFDAPVKSRGHFRRTFDPPGGIANETVSAQVQTTTNTAPTASDITTAHSAQETTTTTTSVTPEIRQPPASNISHIATNSEPTTLPSLPKSSIPPVQMNTLLTKLSSRRQTASIKFPRKKYKVRGKKVSFQKATSAISNNRVKQLNNVINPDKPHLRTAKKILKEIAEDGDIVMSQVESELVQEFNETMPHNVTDITDLITYEIRPIKNRGSSLKIFLKGSTKISIPYPENNAFCHFNPRNRLCGSA